MSQANRDENRMTTLIGTSTADGETPVNVGADPSTKELLVTDGDGSTINLESYNINDVDDEATTANVTYVGMEHAAGAWALCEFDETSTNQPTTQYATVTNNGATTSYSTAWTNRATLTYGDYSIAF